MNAMPPSSWQQKAQLREQEQLKSCSVSRTSPARISFLHLPEATDGELAQDSTNQTRVRHLPAQRQ
jgi:hypothetical protein